MQAVQAWQEEKAGERPEAKPPRQPSALHAPVPPARRQRKKKRRRGQKRRSVRDLRINETVPLHPADLPEDARCIGHRDFVVQELKLDVQNVCYRRFRYRLRDGRRVTAPLPEHVQGHYGHTHCLCNEFFASFTSTDTKSRLNFLQLIRVPFDDYVLGGDACEYLDFYGFPQRRLAEPLAHRPLRRSPSCGRSHPARNQCHGHARPPTLPVFEQLRPIHAKMPPARPAESHVRSP